MRLHVMKYSEKLFFRGFTRLLPVNSLRSVLRMCEARFVVDVNKQPDLRIANFVTMFTRHIPCGETANIMEMERLAEMIADQSFTGRVLVISYLGKNRAPTLCAMADPSCKEELFRLGMPKMPFFKELL